MGKARRILTGGVMLLSAALLQIGMLCPLLTISLVSRREQTVSWYTLLKTAQGVSSVVGGVDAAENGRFWVTAAVVILQAGIVSLAVCGVKVVASPTRSVCVFGACASGIVFVVTAIAAYRIYDTLHSFPFRLYRSSVDMEMTPWVMLAVSALGAVMGIWGARCFKIKERAT